MGNNAPKSALPGQTISFTATKAEYSTSKDIVGVFIDDSLLPKGGVFVVGHSTIEHYNADGSELINFYNVHSRILSAGISFNNNFKKSLLLVGCADNNLLVLDCKTLILSRVIKVTLEAEDLYMPECQVKWTNNQYFEKFNISQIITPFSDSVVVGLTTGFLKEYSLSTLKSTKVFNPILFEENKGTLAIENLEIPSISDVTYGNMSELVFVNHHQTFTNCFDRTFTLEETPIKIYKNTGNTVKQTKLKATILKSQILENRNLYLCLSSVESKIYVFDFQKDQWTIQIGMDILKDPSKPLDFKNFVIYEFGMNQRFQSANKVFQYPKIKDEKIDGDILFAINNDGTVLVSKVTFSESNVNEIAWKPLKLLNATVEGSQQLNTIQKSTASKSISSVSYHQFKDQLVFADHTATIHALQYALKLVYLDNSSPQV